MTLRVAVALTATVPKSSAVAESSACGTRRIGSPRSEQPARRRIATSAQEPLSRSLFMGASRLSSARAGGQYPTRGGCTSADAREVVPPGRIERRLRAGRTHEHARSALDELADAREWHPGLVREALVLRPLRRLEGQ